MPTYLYEISLSRGRSNPNHTQFLLNVQGLHAKTSSYGGIDGVCILRHTQDARAVHLLCTDGFKAGASDVEVTEITRATLADDDSTHRTYIEVINNAFLPYGDFPNLGRSV